MKEKSFYIEDKFNGNVVEISNLFKTEGDEDKAICNPDFLQWQYIDNPNGKAVISCAKDTDTNELVGVYIVNPVKLWLNKKEVLGALSLNTFTHKDYRGKGMFTQLAKTCYRVSKEENLQLIIGFPNPLSYGGFIRKLEFDEIGELKSFVKPLSALNIVSDLFKKSGTESAFNELKKNISDSNIIILEKDNYNLLSEFFVDYREKVGYQTYRSKDYFAWRYDNHPINDYITIGYRQGEKIIAYATLTYTEGKTRNIELVDFCTLDDNGSKLITWIISKSKRNFSFIKTNLQYQTDEVRILEKAGFKDKSKITRKKYHIPFIARVLTMEPINLEFENWHIVMSDSDVS